MMMLVLSACGVATPAATPTATVTNTPIPPTFTPTATVTPTRTPRPTATPDVEATQHYENFVAFVQRIYDAGQISTMDGTYVKLDDFSDELAMGYGYRWESTGVEAKDFILKADFDWSVANQKNFSGCGYVFRQESGQYYYLIALDAINGVFLSYTKWGISAASGANDVVNYPVTAAKKNKFPKMGSNPYHAAFTLVVSDNVAYTYVNGDFFTEHRLKNDWLTDSGPLSSMVLTGSATDYGTRCKITNAEVWIIDP